MRTNVIFEGDDTEDESETSDAPGSPADQAKEREAEMEESGAENAA